jgi:myo-inositol 2-dehydrogenase/D-chiro-inositol 1-dehydrogenase
MVDPAGLGFTTVVVALHLASGAVGSLVGSYDSSYAYPNTHMVEVNGRDGRVLIEDTVRRYTFNRAGDETAQVW